MRGDFYDTNILIYATSANDLKFERADALIASGGTISVQVLNEFTNVARKKMSLAWPPIHHFLKGIRTLIDVCPLDIAMHDRALAMSQKHGFHIYDALIVAAALATDCTTLFSENMHHGLVIDGQRTIVNPFPRS